MESYSSRLPLSRAEGHHINAGQQIQRIEGLCNVVLCPQTKTAHLMQSTGYVFIISITATLF